MATLSESQSVADQTTSSGLLNFKENQNLILDFNSSKYGVSLQPIIECLRHSPLALALSMAENVPLVHLYRAYSTTKWVTGSDSASKFFCTFIYGLYHGIKLDYGSILWVQLVQSTLSTTRHSKISCARFWSIIVHRAITKLNITVIEECIIATIPIFHILNFIMSDPTKFNFIGSLPEAMLNCVPIDNELINKYQKKPASGPHPLTLR
ncbi:unnamed protein product [Lactuca saligna]|uniref:Uncharacterized protein n=1 Tax=Lactuca saligna TaxID=75948 RepID=A0AA35V068_LACSI|nr:unnamed protein product [Lactuca saligna]